MKAFFLTFLLASAPLAHSAGAPPAIAVIELTPDILTLFKPAAPDYPVPPNASDVPETCTVTQLVATPSGGGWSEFRPEIFSESHRTRYWTQDLEFYSLERADDGKRVVHTRMAEDALSPGLSQRHRYVTEWSRVARGWDRQDYEVTQTVSRRPGEPARIVETIGRQSFVWDVNAHPEGDEQVTERSLRNPSALSTEKRKVGNYAQVCHSRVR